MGVSVAVWVLNTLEAGSHQGSRLPAKKKSDSDLWARRKKKNAPPTMRRRKAPAQNQSRGVNWIKEPPG
jgi:hypothetical protein